MQYLFGEMRFFLLTTPSESSAQPLCCGPTPPVNWHIHVFHLTAADWMSAGCWTVDMSTWECFAGQKLVLELSNGHLDTGGRLWFHYLWCTLKLKGWGGIQNKSVYFCAFLKKKIHIFFFFFKPKWIPDSFFYVSGVRWSPLLCVNILFPGLNKQWGAKHGRHMISCMGLVSPPWKIKVCVVFGTWLKKTNKKNRMNAFNTEIKKCHPLVATHSSRSGMRKPGGMRRVGDAEQRHGTGLYRWLCWVCGSWVQHVPLFLSFWLTHTVKLQRQRCFVLTLV